MNDADARWYTRCFECEQTVLADEFDKHECVTENDGYDPAEPWMDPADVDDDEEERDA